MNAPDQILLATGNAGKVRELRALLAEMDVDLLGLDDWARRTGNPVPEIAETGETFYGNCLLKARGYGTWSGLPVIAEDSGICVPVLGGAPGIYSARFAGGNGDDAANNRKLLDMLAKVPDSERQAYYHTTAVYLASPNAEPVVAEAQWHGVIAREPQGDGGFGYDPLFWVPEHKCTSAELAAGRKNELSHRGKAMADLVRQMRGIWS